MYQFQLLKMYSVYHHERLFIWTETFFKVQTLSFEESPELFQFQLLKCHFKAYNVTIFIQDKKHQVSEDSHKELYSRTHILNVLEL
jgi:hypothetical protein